jgi:copper resistance protein B
MTRIILLLAASALATSPAFAQHAGHNMPGMTTPMPAKPAAKKPVAKKPAAKKTAKKASPKKAAAKKAAPKKATAKKTAVRKSTVKKAVEKPAVDPHAGHDMSSMAGMEMPTEPSKSDSHAGHVMPTEQTATSPHAGHDMSATAVEPPIGPPPPEALSGPQNAADTVWGQAAMDPSRAVLLGEHGSMRAGKLLVDQLETRVRKGRDGYFLNAEGWYGGDIDKLWLKTEVEGSYGRKPEQAEFQALWSHAINPWFNLQAGARLDVQPDTRGHLVLGVEGLAPYWIEVDAAAFLSDKGDVTARVEAEHDMRLTQKLILQPRVELDFAAQDMPRERIGSGISSAELGFRLRYQVVPQFAPYIGVNYERAFGNTRRFRRIDGEDLGGWQFVAGLRTWF